MTDQLLESIVDNVHAFRVEFVYLSRFLALAFGFVFGLIYWKGALE